MNHQEPLTPRFAGAVFFAIYSLLLAIFTKYTLLTLRDSAILPLLPTLLIALITGALIGSCFGPWLAKKAPWYRSFLIGILLGLVSMIIGAMIILLHYYFSGSILLNKAQYWKDYLIIYTAILASISLTLGIWLIPLTGFVALYFNKQFLPGLIAADTQRLKKPTKAPDDKK